MREIKFITSNKHKFEELSNFFSNGEIKITHKNMKYQELQANSFHQIVNSSATQLQSIISGNFLIEDSGISINALNGFPGPYSSYVFQTIGWEGILKLMNNENKRSAYFTSIIALIENDQLITFEGKCEGVISFIGKGSDGFGFDPIFIPFAKQKITDPEKLSQEGLTFAQIPLNVKNDISHRSKSMKSLKEYLS